MFVRKTVLMLSDIDMARLMKGHNSDSGILWEGIVHMVLNDEKNKAVHL